jgi:exopolyphosphatase/guanosine-5'-triphosphate,3'-diphosphate pyrophosphatase
MDADQRRVVGALTRQYGISMPHVKKVAELASMLFEGLRTLHRLPPHMGSVLEASAYLYNIGHFVNEAKHHRHSMYLVANSDLPGFEDRERMMIANLCRYHRKSLPQAYHEPFQALSVEDRRAVELLTPLLRAAETQASSVELRLYADRDVDMEQWQAGQVSPAFQQIYGLPLSVRVKR